MASKRKSTPIRSAPLRRATRGKAPSPRALRERDFALTQLIDQPLDLYQHVPYRLATLVNLLALDRDAAIREVSTLGLRELRVLLNIGSYMPIRVSDVAYQTRLDTYTVSRAATTLRDKGLIEMRAEPSDRRVQLARLTESGERQYRQVAQLVEARGRDIASVLTSTEIESLFGMLTRLEDNAESLLATHAVGLLKQGRRISADQRELIRWRKRATAHRHGLPFGEPVT